MSVECSECERDLRGGHDPECSRVTDINEVRAALTAERAAHEETRQQQTDTLASIEEANEVARRDRAFRDQAIEERDAARSEAAQLRERLAATEARLVEELELPELTEEEERLRKEAGSGFLKLIQENFSLRERLEEAEDNHEKAAWAANSAHGMAIAELRERLEEAETTGAAMEEFIAWMAQHSADRAGFEWCCAEARERAMGLRKRFTEERRLAGQGGEETT